MPKDFISKDMYDVGQKESSITPTVGKSPKTRVYYPNVHVDSKRLPPLKNFKFGDKVTIHAHGKITSMQQYNNEPKSFDIELMKIGIKEGHNPRAAWMTQSDYEKYEDCVNDFKGKGNKFAVCMASIKERKKKIREEVSKRL